MLTRPLLSKSPTSRAKCDKVDRFRPKQKDQPVSGLVRCRCQACAALRWMPTWYRGCHCLTCAWILMRQTAPNRAQSQYVADERTTVTEVRHQNYSRKTSPVNIVMPCTSAASRHRFPARSCCRRALAAWSIAGFAATGGQAVFDCQVRPPMRPGIQRLGCRELWRTDDRHRFMPTHVDHAYYHPNKLIIGTRLDVGCEHTL
jgi:hypothetical protein